MKPDINNIYKVLRGKSVVIGLTGAIGSGCTEASNFLGSGLAEEHDIESICSHALQAHSKSEQLESYRIKKIKNYYKTHGWEKFFHLRVSDLIFCLFFSSEELYKYDSKFSVIDWLPDENKIQEANTLSLKIISIVLDSNKSDNYSKTTIAKHLQELRFFIDNNVKKRGTKYTVDFQRMGSKLRESGLNSFLDCEFKSDIFSTNVFTIAQFSEFIINKLIKEGVNYIVIDALRNLHEINYLKSIFANFYLFSIVADIQKRKERMRGCFEFNDKDIRNVQDFENNKSDAYSQNINSCISNGDIFISNELSKKQYYYNLMKYVALIRRPGLFTPTKDERNMQIALTARYNSGCISRQVGACVTGKEGYILGIGWNDVPEGSVPCLYRSTHSLLIENVGAPEFSEYELSSKFIDYMRETKRPNKNPFCFKDVENTRHVDERINEFEDKLSDDVKLSNEQKIFLRNMAKNPTRERALHAEENAFLQSAKTGGISLQDGTLYTTASPCQLCAKKAMQLGINRVVYIDAYPDISTSQTLESGMENKRPKVEQFTGAAESAFMKLFKPLMSIKDELS